MRTIYFAMEAMSAVIILILLYANIFEEKQDTKKRAIFTRLLVANEVVVATDAVTWMNLNWSAMPVLFFVLIMITYIVPFYLQAVFSGYVYEHITEKANVSRTPFRIITYYSCAAGIIAFLLCITGRMFVITDGTYYASGAQVFYYLMYIASMLFLSAVILINYKKLGLHDMLAALSFCVFPLISIVLSLSSLEINLAIPFMAIDTLMIYVMLQSEGESSLLRKSNTDELTGLLNRRAYEDDMQQYPDVPPEADFVYASIDINGLKQVNDNQGHAAGDELICGAAGCLKRTLGNYGRIYRTGGDEFVAMFFADELHLQQVMADLQEQADSWQGKLVESLALSVGYVTKREYATETVANLSKIADKRMYKAKEQYYSRKGTDRRGQNEAHKVLCSLYAKILRINLTADSFTVVNMNQEEQSIEKGYSEHISEWLEGFAKSGYVHPDDIENYLSKTRMDYLQEYFRRGNTLLTLLYRRKFADGFRPALMEILPATDYSEDNQSLFLYVKYIDV